ncbi:acyltransferase family protein [Burkholderia multivorans]|uniref:acyltransferase family protein n=1 Tax=Burkholderia multivorans TaxID=87883 RepID=UPI0018DDD03C|nr:acyltransferase [Burkholderia multivorans]MBH9661032.1 acyltransferase [Burkholderia multivorans]
MKKHISNNFGFLRLFAASLVVLSHISPVLGRGPENLAPLGLIGVIIFFSISGYLVTQSWDRDPNALRFWMRRALRIAPGLVASVAMCALVIGPYTTDLPLNEYFKSPVFFGFFRNIFLFPLSQGLPGVFLHNPMIEVNGPLWTLPMEVTMYIAIAALATIRLWSARYLWTVLTGCMMYALYAYAMWGFKNAPSIFTMNSLQLALSAVAFLTGAVLARSKIEISPLSSIAVAAIIFELVAIRSPMITPIIVMLVPFASISLGAANTPILNSIDRIGDVSYGMYIYAFPLQQLAVFLWPQMTVPAFIAWSLAIPAAMAFISWHLIERPALRLKPFSSGKSAAIAPTSKQATATMDGY